MTDRSVSALDLYDLEREVLMSLSVDSGGREGLAFRGMRSDADDRGLPVAPVVPETRAMHGVEWTDGYAWMRDHGDERLAAHLRAERAHYDRATRHSANLRDQLLHEHTRRLPGTEESVPWRRGDFFYYLRSVTGREYEQFMCKRDLAETGRVLLDPAEFAAGTEGFVEIGVREPSPDGRLLAYSVDTDGDEVYRMRFRDITTGTDLPDEIPRTYYTGAWSADSSCFFYTVHDELYRPHEVWRHTVGGGDERVLAEPDARFEVAVRATRSGRWIVIEATSRDTGETWLVPADRPDEAPRSVRPRRTGVEYRLDHSADPDAFLVVTNDGASEFHLLRAPGGDPGTWSPLPSAGPDAARGVPAGAARPGERLVACHVLAGRLLLELRRDGFPLLRVVDRATGAEREITASVPAGVVALDVPFEYADPAVVVREESLVQPPAWYRVDLATGDRTLVRRRDVPGYDPARYRTGRRHAPAADGTPVPVTLAWREDTPLDGTAPALLWGYGAYESCDDPFFDPALPSLLDRGVVYALTHPRGGGENGRAWWQGGRLANKATTFTDHIAVADHLAAGVVDPARIATRGLSAGGLLQGAVWSMRPDRWCAVVAEVPFVDVVTTMLDPDIPLTVNEWDEWGDPRDPEVFALMRSYAPYENPPAGPRPPLLVTAAVHDPRVMVHEPAKWVARLRTTAGPDDVLLFRVETGAGAHTGPAGRYAHAAYEAEILAFLLTHLSPQRT
jgi:oligopeptidase B